MAAIIICSDFGASQNKVLHCFHCFPIKKKKNYRVRILSQDYTFVVFCVARSLQKLFWHNHSFTLHTRKHRAVTPPCQLSSQGNLLTCGSISSNQCFKLSAEYAALELRSYNDQFKSNSNQEFSPMGF